MALDKKTLEKLKDLKKEVDGEMDSAKHCIQKKKFGPATMCLFSTLRDVQDQLDIIVEALEN